MPQRNSKAKKFPKPARPIDFTLFFLTLAILAFGLIMVLTAGSVKGFNATQNSFFYAMQQLKWAFLGGLLALFASKIPYFKLRKFAGLAILGSLILLVAVMFTDAGIVAKGSARWIKVGPVNFQPSETAKLALILFLAHVFDRYPVRNLRDLAIPVAAVVPVLGLVYKQPDLGTTMVLALTFVAMLLQTELPTRWFIIGIPLFAVPLMIFIRNTPYQWDRIVVWLNPWDYASDLGYQITNAQIAFGSGGLFGVGLGQSMQKFGFLPETYTDMIYAIIGEELGLWGALLLLGLFAVFFVRGFNIARKCPDRFGRLMAFGITTSLAIQTCMNMAVVTGVMPVTGVTLPLVSYGGSSLLMTLVEIGILLNISRYIEVTTVQKEAEISV